MAGAGGIKAGKAFVIIDAVDKTGFVMKRVGKRLNNLAARVQNMGRGLVTGGLASLLPAAASMKVFTQFDDAMKRVEARSTGTASELKAVRDEAKLLGRTTSFTATQVADLQGKLAQKNFSRKDIKDMTGNVLSLARAGGSGDEGDAELSADLISGTLRAFKMEASESAMVADVFTAAINNSNFDLQGLMDGMKKAAPLAKEYGLSLQETTASLAAMTNLNIEASEAGTAFQSFLARMSQPKYVDGFNKKLKAATGQTVEFTDAAGNLRKPMAIMQDIANVTKGMGTAKKGEVLSELFGVRQFGKAAGSISGGKGAMELLDTLNKSAGTAKETAEKMDSGVGGSFRKIMSAVEGLAIEIGEVLAPTIQSLTDTATKWIGSATEWIQNNKGLVVLVTGLAVGAVALGAALFGLSIVVGLLGTLFTVLGTILTLVKVTILALGAIVTSPFLLVAALIAGIIVALWNFNSTFREIFGGIGKVMGETFGQISETVKQTFGAIIKALGQGDFLAAWELLVAGAQLVWAQLVDGFMKAWAGFAGFFVEAWAGAIGMIKELWLSAQNAISDGMLELAEQQTGMMKWTMDAVLGVDVAAEQRRAVELERQRRDMLKKQGLDPGADNTASARKILRQDFDKQMAEIHKETAETVQGFHGLTRMADQMRQAEIQEKKAALANLVAEVDAREEAKQEAKEEAAKAAEAAAAEAGGVGGGLNVDGPLPPQLNTALMAGSVEAAQQAYKNSVAKVVEDTKELDEERNDHLLAMRVKLDEINLSAV